jgi:hypothetical protein
VLLEENAEDNGDEREAEVSSEEEEDKIEASPKREVETTYVDES